MDVLNELGTLKCKYWRSRVAALPAPHIGTSTNTSEVAKVNEKALKGRAISHRTVLGQAKTTKAGQSQVITTKLDPYFRPYVTFIFKYQSRRRFKPET